MGDVGQAVGVATRWTRLIQASALIGYGVVSVTCGMLTKGYAAEYGGEVMWWVSMAVGAVFVPLGVLYGVVGEKRQWGVLAVIALSFGAGTSAHSFVPQPPILLAGASVVTVPFFVLLWRRAGRVRLVLGLAGVAVCALQLVRITLRILSFPPLTGPPVAFDIMLVDESACDAVAPEVPATGPTSGQATVGVETVSGRTCSFVRFDARTTATFKEARREADGWAAARVKLPVGTRLAWGRVEGEPGMVLRSYAVREPAILTSADVSDADVQTDNGEVSLTVTFKSAATDRLQTVTREHLNERLAMLLDGGVHVAPLIRSEIKGGNVLISLTDTTPAQARSLAAALRGELLHAPAGWGLESKTAP